MRRDTFGGWCLVANAVMGLVTMALHPTTVADPALVLAVHALALAGVPVGLYGAWVLARRLGEGGPAAELAFAFYGLAAAATLMAATASGLLAPDVIARAAAAAGDTRAAEHAVVHYNHAVNQAFARVFVAASSVAILLWSAEMLRTRLFARAAGVVGCAVAALTLLGLFAGHLRMDVHGFGAVVLGQAIWLVMVGLELRRGRPAAAAS